MDWLWHGMVVKERIFSAAKNKFEKRIAISLKANNERCAQEDVIIQHNLVLCGDQDEIDDIRRPLW